MALNLLSLEEAAKILRVSLFTIRAWRAQRRFPVCKLGRRVLVKAEDLELFAEKGMIEARKTQEAQR